MLTVALAEFEPSHDYGHGEPAWRAGYVLAERTRERLGLGLEPIESMRDLVEHRLGIPIIQVALPTRIAGATVSSHGQRGIVLNTAGANSNVWIRRTTMAHELAHILFDPEEQLSNVRVDSYDETARAEHGAGVPRQCRAARERLRGSVPGPARGCQEDRSEPCPSERDEHRAGDVELRHRSGRSTLPCRQRLVGTGRASARTGTFAAEPTDEQVSAENFTLDYFHPQSAPESATHADSLPRSSRPRQLMRA